MLENYVGISHHLNNSKMIRSKVNNLTMILAFNSRFIAIFFIYLFFVLYINEPTVCPPITIVHVIVI